ncbi:hypothetical protein NKI15_26515 [Mesorhizobium sp. M0862]
MMRQLVRDAIDKNSEDWMVSALDQLFHAANDHSRLPPAERFAMGKELSEHILALNPPQGDSPKYRSYPAVAGTTTKTATTIAYRVGRTGTAVVGRSGACPGRTERAAAARLLQALAKYRSGKVCYGALCATPQNKPPGGAKARPGEKNMVGIFTGRFIHFQTSCFEEED